MVSVSDLQLNEKARIIGFSSPCLASYKRQLMSMGILPNSIIRVVRRAPLGDPIQICVRDYALTLRKQEAAIIEVERI